MHYEVSIKGRFGWSDNLVLSLHRPGITHVRVIVSGERTPEPLRATPDGGSRTRETAGPLRIAP
jgi:hypothetical protein